MKTLKTLSAKLKEVNNSIDASANDVINLRSNGFYSILSYSELLDLPVTLSQFIPCENGKPLEKPERYDNWVSLGMPNEDHSRHAKKKAYQKACESVLFEGWELRVNQLRLIGENYIIQIQSKGFSLLSRSLEILGTLSTLHDLAEATTENPLKLKQ